jgi:hypothetical protein
MNINDCKGCYSNVEGLEVMRCNASHTKKDSEIFAKIPMCPCAICIVKMMCNLGCTEYNTFIVSNIQKKKLI